MVTDLRAVHKVIQPVASLQSGIPLPSLSPKGWPLLLIHLKDCYYTFTKKDTIICLYLKDCFFTLSSQEKDREKNCLHGDYL